MKQSIIKKYAILSLSVILLASFLPVNSWAETFDDSSGTVAISVGEELPEVGALTLSKVPSFEKALSSPITFDGKLETADFLEIRDTRIVKGDYDLKAEATQLSSGGAPLGINDFRIKTTKKTAVGLAPNQLNAKANTSVFQTNGTLLHAKGGEATTNYDLALGATDFLGTLSHTDWSSVGTGSYTGTITYTLVDGLWEEPIAPLVVTDKDGFGGSVGVTDAGDEVTLANAQWRILKVDGDKALVLKTEALTATEITDLDKAGGGKETVDSSQQIKFHDTDGNYFSNGAVSTGYGESKLKRVIDEYYEQVIAKTSAKDYILPVDLDLPTFENIKNGKSDNNYISTGSYSGPWSWSGNYYREADFATSLTDINSNDDAFIVQAFALSYGDINTTMASLGNYEVLLGGFNVPTNFWLRSAGNYYSYYAGYANNGSFNNNTTVNSSLPVRPALWISLGTE